MEDPNPQVDGGGIENLRNVGIDVDVGIMRYEAEALNRGFLHRIKSGRPWTVLKVAASLDGRTAMRSGESQWISGDQSRRDVHHWRARSSAILTGIGTVLADDPALTVRDVKTKQQPLRVVVDSKLSTPPSAKILSQPGRVLIATANERITEDIDSEHVEVVYVPATNNTVDLVALMVHLAQREINEVLVEAGPTLSGAMLQANLVDEVLIYLAPKVIGSDGIGMFSLHGLDKLTDCVELDVTDLRQFGDDVRIQLRPLKH